jgi:IS1 family transposase
LIWIAANPFIGVVDFPRPINEAIWSHLRTTEYIPIGERDVDFSPVPVVRLYTSHLSSISDASKYQFVAGGQPLALRIGINNLGVYPYVAIGHSYIRSDRLTGIDYVNRKPNVIAAIGRSRELWFKSINHQLGCLRIFERVQLINRSKPLFSSYTGIDGSCNERSPSSVFYRLLSGVLAIFVFFRLSRGLIIKGDDGPYFFGIVRWWMAIPLAFLSGMYGFSVCLDCVFYFTNPRSDTDNVMMYQPNKGNGLVHYFQHDSVIVPRKYLDAIQLLGYSNCSEVVMANMLSTDKKIAVIGALAEGSSIRSIERITGVHRDTIMRLGVKVGQDCTAQDCTAMMDAKMRNLSCKRLEMDEIWGFVGKKERHVKQGDSMEVGSVWTFCAIDSDTKLVPAFKVGHRDPATTQAFVKDVAERMAYRVQISTDGLRHYVAAMDKAFGQDVDYAQIIKIYGNDQVDNRRYSPPSGVQSAKKLIYTGNPEEDLISTSYVERLNATTRLHMRRLTRLTLAFSKKHENFVAAVGLHFAYYNFVKRHNTLRMTPAMAAGVESTQLSVGELLEAAA